MVFAIVIVLLIWLLWILSPYIRRWAARRTANYVQDQIYRSMGIDPKQMRQESQGNRQRRKNDEQTDSARNTRRNSRNSYRSAASASFGKIIPREYGETITFEVLQVVGTEKWLTDTDKSPVTHTYRNETQITDVKYTIIS